MAIRSTGALSGILEAAGFTGVDAIDHVDHVDRVDDVDDVDGVDGAGDVSGVERVGGVEGAALPVAGWQMAEFADAGGRSMTALVRQTGAPAVMVSFLDSDVGFAEAGAPGGGAWEGLLNREMAESYEIPLEQFPVETAVAGALAWSAAAGLTADEALLRRAFTGSALFAEELSAVLFAGLGIPGARIPDDRD
ncbi:hypothetical protein FCH28_18740 [Streptomyces piniterrae]|uniref:Uncharacterized protein n=1 Tax=Streptomyces piniterrae TaxID=2571125 RepID=A0A4U0ND62_9ACTN|nr:hypothetical protein [Streptomyces piniterrae]TJZ51900.1 hypothetical protein FCH28_18740 [Streptomyces piniterrae]